MLRLSRNQGQSLRIGDDVSVTVDAITPDHMVTLNFEHGEHQFRISGHGGEEVELGDIYVEIDRVLLSRVLMVVNAPEDVLILRAEIAKNDLN